MESDLLLKRGEESAVESINARARVSRGKLEGRERRAWRADSFAEDRAADGGGDGSLRRVSSDKMPVCDSGEGMSSEINGGDVDEAAAVARHRLQSDWERD